MTRQRHSPERPGTSRTFLPFLALLTAGVLLTGCATRGAVQDEPNPDPLEAINRPIYKFNEVADRFVLRPVAKGYNFILPRPIRTGVANFYDNFTYPVVIFNSLLQGKFKQGLSDVGRYVVNTTVGVLGFLDPATDAGLAPHNEDFGQTLARWGVPAGPYLIVPFFGPNTVRDGTGQLVDLFYLNPVWDITSSSLRSKIFILGVIQARARLLSASEQIDAAFDPYLFLREAFLQNREYQIHDGNPPEDEYFDEFDEEFDEDF